MAKKGESQAGDFELCAENKGFSYGEEVSKENVVASDDKPSFNDIGSNTSLNYDKILEHIGQFGRYCTLLIL